MEVKPGYKQTEVGVVPAGWLVVKLEQISRPVRGGSPRPAGSPKYFSGDYRPWLTVAALTNIPSSQIEVYRTDSMLTELGTRFSRTLEPDTVIIANSGATLGVAKLLKIRCCANDGIAALIELNEKVSRRFLIYYINSLTVTLREKVATGNGQPNLNTDLISSIQLPLPPLPEQTAIANALSDVDALIESVEKLIEKKKAIKQGTMQELLTGKRRLPGFGDGKGYRQTEVGLVPEDWEVASLMQLSESLQNGLFLEPARRGNGIPIVNVSDLYGRSPIDIQILELFGASHSEVSRFACKKGDLFFTRSSLVPSGIAKCNYLDRVDDEIVFDSHVVRMRPRQDLVSYSYLFSALSGRACRSFLISNSKTGTLTTIDQAVLRKCPVLLAPLPEQTAIANVLSDMDSEIEALESKLTKTKQLKQGMMSELLTGRIRLV
jgi:type I restriction enzyme S subunit